MTVIISTTTNLWLYSFQGSHTGQRDFGNSLADGNVKFSTFC
jgi:hypothetical protein